MKMMTRIGILFTVSSITLAATVVTIISLELIEILKYGISGVLLYVLTGLPFFVYYRIAFSTIIWFVNIAQSDLIH